MNQETADSIVITFLFWFLSRDIKQSDGPNCYVKSISAEWLYQPRFKQHVGVRVALMTADACSNFRRSKIAQEQDKLGYCDANVTSLNSDA